jgi:hypothetical protein
MLNALQHNAMSASETNSGKFEFWHMTPCWVLNVDTNISNYVDATHK